MKGRSAAVALMILASCSTARGSLRLSGPDASTSAQASRPERTQSPSASPLEAHPPAVFNPEGRIAFTRGGDIYSLNPDGTDLRRLTDWPQDDRDPTFSPDGSQIAFVRDVDPREPPPYDDYGPLYERFEIFVMNGDGSHVRRLTHDAAEEGFLAWSPDGSRIGFTRSLLGKPMDIWVKELATGRVERLTDGTGDSYSPSWSPDGSKIAFYSTYRDCQTCSNGVIYLMNADGSDERPLIRGGRSGAADPVWSPDGQALLFMYGYYSQFDMYLARPDGENIRRLTQTPISEGSGCWSPDGRHIVYDAGGDLFVLNVKEGTTLRLTRGREFDYAPSWGVSHRP